MGEGKSSKGKAIINPGLLGTRLGPQGQTSGVRAGNETKFLPRLQLVGSVLPGFVLVGQEAEAVNMKRQPWVS